MDGIKEEAKEEKGRSEILGEILSNLINEGYFLSSFVIDSNGMLISEYYNKELNAIAVGAMFSLVCTNILRTVKNLDLNKLEYFKLSSSNGEFLLKHIVCIMYFS